ncbi:predicted protein [Botrytis cinerea T4]|uniref:Uncharacterized protein n=1 Tax=Botryotinia fuckeliana (strain T4) TaxID=999810 RepID=G2XZS0_BOTF4|nr:predicted protein [Botrytis cinerea T4]
MCNKLQEYENTKPYPPLNPFQNPVDSRSDIAKIAEVVA